MSKDPFEELFGPAEPAAGESQPVPARDRLAFEQAERIKTSPLPTTKPEQPEGAPGPAQPPAKTPRGGGSTRSANAKPWIIVGLVTVFALIASIVVMNLARAGDDAATAETTAPAKTSEPATSAKPTTETEGKADGEKKDTTKTKEAADEPPAVDPGPTGDMNVPLWGITAQISGKFGWPQYEIRGEQLVLIGSPLIDQLPDSCSAMREQWGIERTATGSYTVLKPAHSCAAAPELYDEIWGLTAAMVSTIQPG
ncbi:hypothetical protein [Leucobacter sp. gxy201]|uniref:hypothetical protein n=1 Tax=Leucobacter sp. gxy201 TaxID=2957200 RepID=UPI003DA056F7